MILSELTKRLLLFGILLNLPHSNNSNPKNKLQASMLRHGRDLSGLVGLW